MAPAEKSESANDDPVQARKAADLLAGPETILIAHSVLLELEWVLRAVYELSRPAILKAMRQVLGLPSTHIEQENPFLPGYVSAWPETANPFLAQSVIIWPHGLSLAPPPIDGA
ncbi:hypothetical protein [uncultured Thiodictyon sp.]|uniref:hypothetical protein n=1 Tax=uncultured Thiodictyon sp. TaxID=1846217 RepID=UPI0025DD732F|nr:hypothetical protein [uncultured Thiodictyon sp.]